ncbi:antibiotic biosynthesis monooxygenase family protein [Spongorhabdus nitratireducens]
MITITNIREETVIKVIIKRSVASGLETHFDAAIQRTLHEVNEVEGYISGITLQQVNHPRNRLVITTWESEADWKAWQHSAARQRLISTINPMLEEQESIQVYSIYST